MHAPSRRPLPFAALALALAVVAGACSSAAPTEAPSAAPATEAPATAAPATTAPTEAPTPSPVPAFPVTLTDDEGTAVTIPAEPQRIVSLTPAATETLFALGVGDRVVGKAQDIMLFPPEAESVPDFEAFDGSAIVVDTEKIVAAKTDLVIAGGNYLTPPEAITKIRSLGIPVVVVYASTVDKVFTDIELIGQATGATEAATAMTTYMRDQFKAIADAVAGQPKPRVYYEIDATGGYWTASDKSFLAEMIQLAGGEPITTGSPDKYDIAAERLIAADPEVILLADAAWGVKAEDVAKRAGWKVLTAVKNNAILAIDDTTISRPGPRIIGGLAILAAAIHADATIPAVSPVPAVP